jgi:protein SCO1/2
VTRTAPEPSFEVGAHAAAVPQLPGGSIYNLDIVLTDQRAANFRIGDLRGHPVLIAMFYASCTTICPMLIEELKHVDASLDPDVRRETRIVLVTFDPEHDTIDRLAELAKAHGVDDERWHFARTSESGTRDTAALLGMAYQATGGGQFNHSAKVTLLNRAGEVVLQVQESRAVVSELPRSIARIVATPADT